MKKTLLIALLLITNIIIFSSPNYMYAAINDTVNFINDTPKNQVLSFKYELSSVATLSPLLGIPVTRLIWIQAGETSTIVLKKNCCRKYVGIAGLAHDASIHFEKIHSGKLVKISTLRDYQKYGKLEDALTYQEQVIEEAKKLVKARKSVLNKFDRDVNISNRLELAIIAPQRSSKQILDEGFHNQYQIGASRGLFNPAFRHQAEARSLSMAVSEYQQISNDVKPKYGMVFSRSFFSDSDQSLGSQYGEDIYLLKWSHLKDRLTWTAGSPVDPHDNKGFIPWSVKQPYSSISVRFYKEFQIWGPVMPGDIKAFIFTKSPPDQGMMRVLARHGIEVYDGREGCPVVPYQVIEDVA